MKTLLAILCALLIAGCGQKKPEQIEVQGNTVIELPEPTRGTMRIMVRANSVGDTLYVLQYYTGNGGTRMGVFRNGEHNMWYVSGWEPAHAWYDLDIGTEGNPPLYVEYTTYREALARFNELAREDSIRRARDAYEDSIRKATTFYDIGVAGGPR